MPVSCAPSPCQCAHDEGRHHHQGDGHLIVACPTHVGARTPRVSCNSIGALTFRLHEPVCHISCVAGELRQHLRTLHVCQGPKCTDLEQLPSVARSSCEAACDLLWFLYLIDLPDLSKLTRGPYRRVTGRFGPNSSNNFLTGSLNAETSVT